MTMHPSTFQYLQPSPKQIETMTALRKAFERLQFELEALVPDGRYKSLAVTKLEECAMHANKGIMRDSDGTPREGATL
jgi:hypothetical protein